MARKGQNTGPKSEETKRKMSEAAKRRYRDPEQLQQARDKFKRLWAEGAFKNASQKGRKRSEETRRKMSEAQKRRFAALRKAKAE